MIVARPDVFRRIVLWWHVCGVVTTTCAAAVGGDGANVTRGVDEFLTSLTQMIGTVLNSDARYSPRQPPDDGTQQAVVSGRPNGPAPGTYPADYFDTGRPPFVRPYPPPPPPPPYQENGPRPGYFRPGPVPYPQQPNSVLQALGSISRHDDLRCVPRLLCEVSSGARPSSSGYNQPGGYYQQQQQQQQQQSSIPFLSKDALITLLTVLNFVDDSPLLMFGRAALLGYNARGDPRSCTTAYPTCPRDPDQLIDYLNNHNGGFFRFFNQQLPQYAPDYAVHQQRPPYQQQRPPFPQRPPYPPQHQQRPPFPQRPPYPPQHEQYAPQYPLRPRQHFKNGTDREGRDDDDADGSPRILSGSAGQSYYHVPSVNDLALDVPRPPMTFPSGGGHDDGAANAVAPFAFPSSDRHRRGKSDRVKMVFPDRTGTGGLRAQLDQYGNYKGVYYADGAVRFVDDNGRPSKAAPPTSHFDVAGVDRLPYLGRRPRFQFPKTA